LTPIARTYAPQLDTTFLMTLGLALVGLALSAVEDVSGIPFLYSSLVFDRHVTGHLQIFLPT
jgi:hypothetical protein